MAPRSGTAEPVSPTTTTGPPRLLVFAATLAAFALFPVVAALIRAKRFAWLKPFLTGGPSAPADAERRMAVSIAARRVRRVAPNATCLVAASIGKVLMNALGRHSVLTIGVAAKPGGMRAHAWLSDDAALLVGGPAAKVAEFTVLEEIV